MPEANTIEKSIATSYTIFTIDEAKECVEVQNRISIGIYSLTFEQQTFVWQYIYYTISQCKTIMYKHSADVRNYAS